MKYYKEATILHSERWYLKKPFLLIFQVYFACDTLKVFQCVYLTLSIFTVVLQVLLLLYFSSTKSQSLIYISVGDVTCVFACNAY